MPRTPGYLPPGLCEELRQRVYTLFGATQYDAIASRNAKASVLRSFKTMCNSFFVWFIAAIQKAMNVMHEPDKKWVLCPVCGAKTRLRLLQRTVLKDFPLFCPKCRQERIINARNFQIEIIDQPDAKTQC